MRKILSIVLILIITLAGCSSNSASNSVMTYSSAAPQSLDITQISFVQSLKILSDANQTLYEMDRDGNLVLGGAKDVQISDDGLVYTILLNDTLKWVDSSGEVQANVTADDYVFAYQNMVDPTISSGLSYLFSPIVNANDILSGDTDVSELGVKALDEYTLEITLNNPVPYFNSLLANVAYAPQPSGAKEMYSEDYASSAQTTWYSGPFYITNWDKDYQIELSKNMNYYDADNVELEGVNYRITDDPLTALNAFDSGSLDFVEIKNETDYNDRSDVDDRMTTAVNFFRLNTESDLTGDINFRKALYYGFNKDSILDAVYGDINTAIDTLVPTGLTPPAYDGEEYQTNTEGYGSYDPEKAKEYLDTYMQENGISDPSEITLDFLTAESDKNAQIAEALQANYVQVLGINVNVDTKTSSTYYEARSGGAFDMVGGIWIPDYNDPSTYLDIFTSINIGGSNLARFDSQEYDDLALKARSENDVQERFATYHEMEDMLFDNYLVIPFYQMNEPYVVSDEFEIYTTGLGYITNKYTTIN